MFICSMPTKKVTSGESGKTKTPKVSKKDSKPTSASQVPCANGEQCFWVHNGPVLSDLIELRDVLKEIHDEVYAHHVDGQKNDFADWVEHVLGDAECAEALRRSSKKTQAKKIVDLHLSKYAL